MDSVISNGFSIEIIANVVRENIPSNPTNEVPVEKVVYKNSNYYSLPENTVYKIKLGNYNFMRVDAHVWIDGVKVGVWRINPESSVTIDKPATNNNKFVITKRGTVGMFNQMNSFENGLVKVQFVPEQEQAVYKTKQNYKPSVDPTKYPFLCSDYSDTVTPYTTTSRLCAMDPLGYVKYTDDKLSHGMLFKSGEQIFKKVGPVVDVNNDLVTIIYVRLIIDEDEKSYRRKYMMYKEGDNQSIPSRMDLQHPVRPHTCITDSNYTLSRTYWYDNLY